ncbi:hypothetical protein SAMN05216228_102862 [Rhizobium tibeticum]|uniref:Uncharacterized protein n=1 Tax=Rhizobium tibeticum TaxID=501024 RepID=A0A1H8TEW4_9HYPH|nr:hypothetical protein RTCCBAU85039_5163 [Rhizobium tibeticum]SEO89134.1 hypothetical protein SAMN05216228_102862 [Rhizobium tibeticum]
MDGEPFGAKRVTIAGRGTLPLPHSGAVGKIEVVASGEDVVWAGHIRVAAFSKVDPEPYRLAERRSRIRAEGWAVRPLFRVPRSVRLLDHRPYCREVLIWRPRKTT